MINYIDEDEIKNLNVYNVYNTHIIQKQKLLDYAVDNLIMSIYNENGKDRDTIKVLKSILNSFTLNNYCLGVGNFTLWREQEGEMLDKSMYYNFGISRQFGDKVLNDEEFKKLGTFITIILNGFDSIIEIYDFLKESTNGNITIYAFDNYIAYFIKADKPMNLLQEAMMFYNLFPYINLSQHIIVNINTNNEPYLWICNEYLPMGTCHMTGLIKDNEQYCYKLLNADDISMF